MCKYNLGNYKNGPLYRATRIPSLFELNSQSLIINEIYQPTKINLIAVYPNPFNPIINIEYELSVPVSIQFKIYNINGKQIDQMNKGYKFPGIYSAVWNGENYPSGMYVITLESEPTLLTKKMILLK